MGLVKFVKVENKEGLLCEYGCGQIAEYKSKGGKLCCSDNQAKCPIIVKLISKAKKTIKIENLEGLLCEYGCGNKAEYKSKYEKLCCSENWQSCPENIKKAKLYQIPKRIKNDDHKLCDFCNEREAVYKFKNGKLCCEKIIIDCPSTRKNINQKPNKIDNLEGLLCDYGCGKIAKYKYNIGKYCCSESFNSCPEMRKCDPVNSLEDWQNKYPIFSKVEEMRYNPENLIDIQVHCKNSDCLNSIEKGGWFTPSIQQISDRVRAIEKPYGFGECNFYCSENCKNNCPLFRLRNDPMEKINSSYTQTELNTWRQEVLKRQEDELGHNECEMCGNKNMKELQVHHEIPVKKDWIFSLDPDNGIILCVTKDKEEDSCHFKYGHKTGTECSTGNLANSICR